MMKSQGPTILAALMLLAAAPGWSGAPPSSPQTATDLVAACRGKQGQEKNSCYEQGLLKVLAGSGVRPAMDTLAAVAELDRDVQRNGHVYAHVVGIAAYDEDKDIGETFRSCTELFQSGCYHGVIQSYLEDVLDPASAESAERINGICAAYRADPADRFIRFQCLHALGHGLTAFLDHDLPRALKACDALAEDWERQGCWSGAFMENAIHGTGLHHASPEHHARKASASAEAASHDHHAHHGSAGAKPAAFVAVKADDPLYPCTILEEKYLPDCYLMQTSVVLFQKGGDFRKAAAVCDGAPAAQRPWCYQGLGRDASSYTVQDPEESIRLCSVGDARYQPWCFAGLVKNFIDVTAKSESGLAFCPRVPGRANQLKCWEAVGEEIWLLAPDETQRAALCARAGAEGETACRWGARLRRDRPADIPAIQ